MQYVFQYGVSITRPRLGNGPATVKIHGYVENGSLVEHEII